MINGKSSYLAGSAILVGLWAAAGGQTEPRCEWVKVPMAAPWVPRAGAGA